MLLLRQKESTGGGAEAPILPNGKSRQRSYDAGKELFACGHKEDFLWADGPLMAVTFAGCGENSPRQRVTQTVTAALTAPNEVLLAVLSDPSASEEDVVSAMREVFGK